MAALKIVTMHSMLAGPFHALAGGPRRTIFKIHSNEINWQHRDWPLPILFKSSILQSRHEHFGTVDRLSRTMEDEDGPLWTSPLLIRMTTLRTLVVRLVGLDQDDDRMALASLAIVSAFAAL